jgi:hypothetical protein
MSEANRSDDLPDFRPAARATKRADVPDVRDDPEPARLPSVAHERHARIDAIYAAPSRHGRETHLRLGVLLI